MSGFAVAGTRLYFTTDLAPDASSSEGVEILGMKCPTEIRGLDESNPKIAFADSAMHTLHSVGPFVPAQVVIPFNFNPYSRSHQALILMRDARVQASFMVAFGRTTPAPVTVGADGRMVSAGATTAEWLGKVVGVSHGVAIGEIVRSTLTLVRDSRVAWTFPTASMD